MEKMLDNTDLTEVLNVVSCLDKNARDLLTSMVINLFKTAYEEGYEEGHDKGYEEGFENGHLEGYDEGFDNGYQAFSYTE